MGGPLGVSKTVQKSLFSCFLSHVESYAQTFKMIKDTYGWKEKTPAIFFFLSNVIKAGGPSRATSGGGRCLLWDRALSAACVPRAGPETRPPGYGT